jgi:hypothetical protein
MLRRGLGVTGERERCGLRREEGTVVGRIGKVQRDVVARLMRCNLECTN